jgi:hypothetical protein
MNNALVALIMAEAVWCLALLAMLAIMLRTQALARRRVEAEEAIGPVAREALAVFIGGNSDVMALRALAKAHPAVVEQSILAFQAKLGGSERERLAGLAITFGFADQWFLAVKSPSARTRLAAHARIADCSHSPVFRRMAGDIPMLGLEDRDEQVRVEAARSLAYAEDPAQVIRAFEITLASSPLARIHFAPLLRRHAALLCETVVPRVIRTAGQKDLLKMLQLLSSWECNLPLEDLSMLAEHPDAEIRRETMRIGAMVPPTQRNQSAILTGLADQDFSVALAAVGALRRLKPPSAIPQITRCLRRGDAALARAAAAVLAEMAPEGLQALEGQVPNPDPIASKAAREALSAVCLEACA